ncbi:ABC transporter [Chromatiales bacterium (ex Bugula neritina AB1)]|nr:ABC transporter [Chromatiales bacterium (ex Bugula neritina AB1)]
MTQPSETALIETRRISKSFGRVIANSDINLSVAPGQIHALLGENGAGKSTLMKIICGLQQPDTGEIYWKGEAIEIASPKRARAIGIGMVHQHFALFEGLSVAENIAFSIDGAVQGPVLERQILDLAEKFGLAVEPRRPVFELSAGERQRIEILRALLQTPELLILDEPTSVLTPQEADQLFTTVRKLASEGHGIVFISHKLKEVRDLCDAATILRAGRVVGSCDPRTTSPEEIAELMLGSREIKAVSTPRETGVERLRIQNLQLTADAQPLQIDSLSLLAGEVFGVAGVAGNGQELLFAALSGEQTSDSDSTITINETAVGTLGPNDRRALQAMFIPEERLGHAAVPHMSLIDNTLLTNVTNPDIVQNGIVNRQRLLHDVEQIADMFEVRHPGFKRAAQNLSGGNLQKFVVGREILKKPTLLIVNQPTWGVDALSAVRIREALLSLASEGSAILVISQDLDELLEISDRLAVLHHGELGHARPVSEWTVEALGLAMTGSEEPA